MKLRQNRVIVYGDTNLSIKCRSLSPKASHNMQIKDQNIIISRSSLNTARYRSFEKQPFANMLEQLSSMKKQPKQKKIQSGNPFNSTLKLYKLSPRESDVQMDIKALKQHYSSSHKIAQAQEIFGKSKFKGDSELLFDERYKQKNFHKVKEIKGNQGILLPFQRSPLTIKQNKSKKLIKDTINRDEIIEIHQKLHAYYKKRKDLKPVFFQWDVNNKGFISIEDVVRTCENIGIKIDVDQATALVASSSSRNACKRLKMAEFITMLKPLSMNQDGTVKICFNNTRRLQEREKEGVLNNIKEIKKQESPSTVNGHLESRLRLLLKNQWEGIEKKLKQHDEENQGYVDTKCFAEITQALNINTEQINSEAYQAFLNNFKLDDQHKNLIDYKKLIESIKNYQFNPTSSVNSTLPITKHEKQIEMREIYKNDISNHQESQLKSSAISRKVQQYFPSQIDFKNFLLNNVCNSAAQTASLENGDNFRNDKSKKQKFTRCQLKEVLHTMFNSLGEKLAFSNFDYLVNKVTFNKQGRTDLDCILKTIYGNLEQYSKHNDIITKDFALGRSQNMTDIKCLSTALKKVEDYLLQQSSNNYEIFKKFDKDSDGVISAKDIQTKLQERRILNEQELPVFLQYCTDQGQQKYFNFAQFISKVTPGMSFLKDIQTSFKENLFYNDVNPRIIPCKLSSDLNRSYLPLIKQFNENQLSKIKQQNEETSLRVSKRFDHTNHRNTFQLIQVTDTMSPSFISEKERLQLSTNFKTDLQSVEKETKLRRQNANLQNIVAHRQFFQNEIDEQLVAKQIKNSQNLKKKANNTKDYEMQCHINQ